MPSDHSNSIFPPGMQILSGSALKILASVFMLIDHLGVYILSRVSFCTEKLFFIGKTGYSWYTVSRLVGRLAFPIYCFLIVEGLLHTRSRLRYARNLLLFALISELPWNYAHTGQLSYAKQNVYFTLFLGFLGIWAIEYFYDTQLLQFLSLFALFIIARSLNADYGWRGYCLILILYLLRLQKASQAIVASCFLSFEWFACFAFIPINMYNGKRGFLSGSKAGKYLFYLFYPVHILILGYLRFRFFR